MTDIVPFLAYFVAFNFEALGKLSGLKLWASRGCIVLLAAASMFMHGRAATSYAPHHVERHSERHRHRTLPDCGIGAIPRSRAAGLH